MEQQELDILSLLKQLKQLEQADKKTVFKILDISQSPWEIDSNQSEFYDCPQINAFGVFLQHKM